MKPGCYVDGSQMSELDLTVAVIDFAVSLGYEIDHQAYRKDLEHLPVADDEERIDILDSLYWTVHGGVEYLNEHYAPRDHYFILDNDALLLEEYHERDDTIEEEELDA